MFDPLYEIVPQGVYGRLPDGDYDLFADVDQYYQAYHAKEDEIVDYMFDSNNGFEIDDFQSWLEYA